MLALEHLDKNRQNMVVRKVRSIKEERAKSPILMPTMRGGAGALATQGLPAAAGGTDVAQALVSVVPGIRRLKAIIATAQIPTTGGLVRLDLPKSDYLARALIRVEGALQIVQPATAVSMTAGDPRNFVQSVELQLSSTIKPKVLTGLQHDVIDNLDVPVVAANAQTYTVPSVGNGATGSSPFVLELTPRLSISDQNLIGIPYLAAPGTVPQINITFANPNGTLATPGGGGSTITFINGIVKLEGWRIDLPAPVAPRTIQQPDGNGNLQNVQIPGAGLWQESSWVLISKMSDSQDQVTSGMNKKFNLAVGPNYTRIILLSYQASSLDPETSPLLDHADLVIQRATTLESKTVWQFDNEYRQTYFRTRPKGVYVFSGVDLTGTDADLYITGDLGNFTLDVTATSGAGAAYGAAGTKWEVLTQTLQPISTPGIYL